ncbi:hypothetical protein GQ53DRAFT_838146 [Thozetella sp. PMI_491]|nr:hypothetical protein GQ53DRAFT_838146 [Thozetella sp. PMI_491]
MVARSDCGGRFEFVVQEANEKLSKENHSKIRRHAMKAVRAAQQDWGKATSPPLAAKPTGHRVTSQDAGMQAPWPSMPMSGLELLVRDRGLDPMDLSALTSVHIGPLASAMLQSKPSQLPEVLLCRQWSYFSFIPPRFGHVAALDDAFRCLITVAHSSLVPAHRQSQEKILGYYGKALQSLQFAFEEPEARYTAEVLCAVGMLALFELLISPHGRWCKYIAGASDLIRLRGPKRFTTDFDRALLLALCYPICAEALLKNQTCFLDDPCWTEALKEVIAPQEAFTDRSALGITLMTLMAKVPTLAKRVGHAVVIQNSLQRQYFDTIAAEIRSLRSAIIAWRRDFNLALIANASRPSQARGIQPSFSKKHEMSGIALVIHMIASRMLVCISTAGRELLEEEVQSLAVELKTLQASVAHNCRANFFLGQKSIIADAAIATHEDFVALSTSETVVESWKLARFWQLMGRTPCDGETCCASDG